MKLEVMDLDAHGSYFRHAIGVLDICHLERDLKEALGVEKESVVESPMGLALQGFLSSGSATLGGGLGVGP